jgi:hypothetical protein
LTPFPGIGPEEGRRISQRGQPQPKRIRNRRKRRKRRGDRIMAGQNHILVDGIYPILTYDSVRP